MKVRVAAATVAGLLVCACTASNETPRPRAAASSARSFDAPPGTTPNAPQASPAPSSPEPETVPEPTEPTTPDDGTPALSDAPEPVAELPAGLSIKDPGSEPRVVPTVTATVGTKTTRAVQMRIRLAVGVGGREVPPTDIPELGLDVVTEVTAVTRKAITLAVTTDNVRAVGEVESNRVRRALEEAVTDLGGASATITMDRRGGPSAMKMEGGGTVAQMKPSLDGLFDTLSPMFVSLPTEAIGAGAKWEVVAQRQEGGATMQHIIRYTLKHLEGQTMTVTWAIERGTTSVQGDGEAGIEAHGALGKGSIDFDLSTGSPALAEAEINSRTHARVKFGETASKVFVQQLTHLQVRAPK